MASADWYEVSVKKGRGDDAWAIRKGAKYRKISPRIIAFNTEKTLLRIGNKKKGALSQWLKDVRHTSSEAFKGQLPQTFTSHCGWEMNITMKAVHEGRCKRCIFYINDREVKVNAARVTTDIAQEANDYNKYGAPVKVIQKGNQQVNKPRGRRGSSRNSINRSPEVQRTTQSDLDKGFEQAEKELDEIYGKAIDGIDMPSGKTKEAWIAVRDGAEKAYDQACAEIDKIEAQEKKERMEGKKLLADMEKQIKPLEKLMADAVETMNKYAYLNKKYG